VIRAASLREEYATQRTALGRLYPRAFISVPVLDGDGQTVHVWVRNLEQVLTRSDLVIFQELSDDRELALYAMAPWDRVIEVMGRQMVPVPDIYPARWHINEWPNVEQIDLLAEGDLLGAAVAAGANSVIGRGTQRGQS
jgi:hypothetical protein